MCTVWSRTAGVFRGRGKPSLPGLPRGHRGGRPVQRRGCFSRICPEPLNRSCLTQVIVGINVLVFIAMVLSGVSPMAPTIQQLVTWGANLAPLSLGPQPWRMLASNYVHIGLIHIFFNMWCLWNLGRLAERIFGRWTYLLVYTASGIGGSLASLWWHPRGIGAGASGAIFGLAGALIAVLYLGKLPISKEALKPTLKSLITFAAYNLFFGLVPGIDNAAHLSGLATGLGLGAVLARSFSEPLESRARWRNYAAVGTDCSCWLDTTTSSRKLRNNRILNRKSLYLSVIPTGASVASAVEGPACRAIYSARCSRWLTLTQEIES